MAAETVLQDFFWCNGTWWVMQVGSCPADSYGQCSDQSFKITVAEGLTPWQGIDTVCHEITHAVCPYLDEETVTTLGTAVSNGLKAYFGMTNIAVTQGANL